jgi:Family of unknown function (DUF5318)
MSFGPTALRGFTAAGSGGRVEYRLARNAVVKEFHKGRLSRLDVCDAHPELMRAARNVGIGADETCPICEDQTLVNVTYVFGPNLPPNGRCPTNVTELQKLCRRPGEVICYVVEVCPECRWNHLMRTYPGGSATRKRRPLGGTNGTNGTKGARATLNTPKGPSGSKGPTGSKGSNGSGT